MSLVGACSEVPFQNEALDNTEHLGDVCLHQNATKSIEKLYCYPTERPFSLYAMFTKMCFIVISGTIRHT